MRTQTLLLLSTLAVGCSERDPMARTDDLWPRFRRAAVAAFPTEDEIERACGEAAAHFKEEAEKTPGTYVDLEYYDYPVRNPVCRWELEAASTAICRFEISEVPIVSPTAEELADALRRMREEDWRPNRARLVYVTSFGYRRWIAPRGCEAEPRRN